MRQLWYLFYLNLHVLSKCNYTTNVLKIVVQICGIKIFACRGANRSDVIYCQYFMIPSNKRIFKEGIDIYEPFEICHVSHDPLQMMLISTVLPWSIYFGVLCVWYQNDTPLGRRPSGSIATSDETEQYETILKYKNDNWLCFGWNTPHQSNQSKGLSLEIADYYERQLWFLLYLDLHIQSKFNYKTCLSAIWN